MPGRVKEADLRILLEAGLNQEDIRHSILVAEKALDIAERTGAELDLGLVKLGALYHDLGKALTHSYQHGELGAEIGRKLGLPVAIQEIARKHFHGGIGAEEARELGLPEMDYTPRLLEERIIMYADRLVDVITEGYFKLRDEREAEERFEEIILNHRHYGKDTPTRRRYLEYHREIEGLISAAAARRAPRSSPP